LYDGGGHILASATLTTADAQEGSPIRFYTQAITPVTLAANQTYYIAEDILGNTTQFYVRTGTPTTSPLITYGASVVHRGAGGARGGGGGGGGPLHPGFVGPDLGGGGGGVHARPRPPPPHGGGVGPRRFPPLGWAPPQTGAAAAGSRIAIPAIPVEGTRRKAA